MTVSRCFLVAAVVYSMLAPAVSATAHAAADDLPTGDFIIKSTSGASCLHYSDIVDFPPERNADMTARACQEAGTGKFATPTVWHTDGATGHISPTTDPGLCLRPKRPASIAASVMSCDSRLAKWTMSGARLLNPASGRFLCDPPADDRLKILQKSDDTFRCYQPKHFNFELVPA
ncbi:hypothetical protein AB0M22_17030 [Nocardia sp. NPDC051756]|uniref:hypothetical protein n=1 Tax=Nocardia sp. NPDC051756 TaxID=3154751 RepID=UPI003424D0DF